MWDVDYLGDEFPAWLGSLSEEEGDFALAFVTAMSDSKEDPWEFDGVDDVVVGVAGSPWSMLYRAYLRVNPGTELLMIFSVDRESFVREGAVFNGTIHLLEFDVLKTARKERSIEASAMKKLGILRGGVHGEDE